MDPSVIFLNTEQTFTLILEAAWENLHTWDVEEDYPEPKILISVMWIIGDWFYTGKNSTL